MITKKNDKKLPILTVHGRGGQDFIFIYKTREDLVIDLQGYLPNLFPYMKEAFKQKLREIYRGNTH